MTYDEALAFWYGRINYEVRAAQPADLKLERMRALLRRLGDPHERVRLVHVTGTKGKGSTCALLDSVLRAAGYRVGLFTSPHLSHVEERVRVNGAPIPRAELAALMSEIAGAVREMDAEVQFPPPTFFEIVTALGFLHFARRRCELALIEVGLGGRFDSTNVCNPLVSVITTVGFDHVAQLGSTLEAIAFQKAGIIKRRVPVVCGVSQPEARAVVGRVARELGAPVFAPNAAPLPPVALRGPHQRANAAVALAVVDRLRASGLTISEAAVARGFASVDWPARVELVARDPHVVLDSAHNVPSAEALVATLRECWPVPGKKRLVFAVSNDKQFAEMLALFSGYFDHFHLTKYGNNPRCVPPDKLAEALAAVAPGAKFSTHATAPEALAAARSASAPGDLVCAAGSVFLAGELRPLLVPARS
jgi:dihydrofolate synthase/folylpolyglutamate synthase